MLRVWGRHAFVQQRGAGIERHLGDRAPIFRWRSPKSVTGWPRVTLAADAASVTFGLATTGPSSEKETGSELRVAPEVPCATALKT